MKSCDVLIVGGGPAGSSCARRLANAGLTVVVIDKSVFPRDKVCAGWINPAVFEELGVNVAEYQQNFVCQPIHSFKTGIIHGPYIQNDYKRTVSFGIRRYEFDRYLLNRCGAQVIEGEPLQNIQWVADRWVINNRFQTPMLIGAGGHFCPIARYLGAKIGKDEHSVAAQELEFEMSPKQQAVCEVQPDTPELFFYPDLSGYGWVFRKRNYLNLGIGREDSGHISRSVSEFFQFMKQLNKIPQDAPENFKGHAYLLYHHAQRKLVGDNVLLIGDAAGLAYRESGEGILPAVRSGILAADVIIGASGSYGEDDLNHYIHRLTESFGERNTEKKLWFPTSLKQAIAKYMLGNRTLTRHIILDRYFLHLYDPPPHPV